MEGFRQKQCLKFKNSLQELTGDISLAHPIQRITRTNYDSTLRSLWWTGPPWILNRETHGRNNRPYLIHWIHHVSKEISTPVTSHGYGCGEGQALLDKSNSSGIFSTRTQGSPVRLPLPKAHAFNKLTAYIDAQGVRVGGRLAHSSLSLDGKHPAILPRHSHLSSLVIAHAHDRTLHGGTQLTLSHIRQNYWILGGRAPVKSYILRCVVCVCQRGIRAHQLMGQLPLSRVTPSRLFTHTGVDYAGLLTIKTWRGAKTQKSWICDYLTEGFIAAYRRFSSKRGIAHTLHSDCGTNFVGADAALKKLFIQSSREHQHIVQVLSQDHTRWEFNPPAAPHMGGKWEAVVKSIKFHLRRTSGEMLLTFEELSTLLSQIEAILNSRPLEPLSDDPEGISALTPGHFLIGGPLTAISEPSLNDVAISRLLRWQYIQQRAQHFWSQWSSHYLQRQQSISKWHHKRNDIRNGSLVLITDERLSPCKWLLARVTALHPGKDGLARVVTLKTATTTLIRPVIKLAVLPVPASE